MLRHDPFILDRHMIAGEADHAGAAASMPAVERKGAFRGVAHDRLQHMRKRNDHGRVPAQAGPRFTETSPSVAGPESFPRRSPKAQVGYPFGGPSKPRATADAFQSVYASAVPLPERFRGGCSFGDGMKPHSPARAPARKPA